MQLVVERIIIALAVLAGGCAPDEEDTTPSTFGQRCADDSQCDPPFSCLPAQLAPGMCTKRCETDNECPSYHLADRPCDPDFEIDYDSSCWNGFCAAFIYCDDGEIGSPRTQ